MIPRESVITGYSKCYVAVPENSDLSFLSMTHDIGVFRGPNYLINFVGPAPCCFFKCAYCEAYICTSLMIRREQDHRVLVLEICKSPAVTLCLLKSGGHVM